MASSASQLRFSARPTVEVYPAGWDYDHKSYLSDHDWRVDSASTSQATTSMESRGVNVSKRTKTNVAPPSRPLVSNTLLFSRRGTPHIPAPTSTATDALEEYNFTVFKGGKRRAPVHKKSNESNWWNTEEIQHTGRRKGSKKDVVGANPYQVKTSKTISIHGDAVYEMLGKAAQDEDGSGAGEEGKGGDDFKVDVTRRKLFDVREPPVRARNAGEKEVIEKVRANSFLRHAPSTYVDAAATVISDKEGEPIDNSKLGTKRNKPVWVSSTLLEDNLDHANTGAINALKYVEERSRKFALAQSVAKLNHKMKKNHATRKLEEQALKPMKETIVKLERRQDELEDENKELQQLVKELAEVIEDHNRYKFERESSKPKGKKTPTTRGGGSAGVTRTTTAVRSRRSPARPSTSISSSSYERRAEPTSKSKNATRPPFDLSPGKVAMYKTDTESKKKKPIQIPMAMAMTPPKTRKQRSQWIQPRMTAKQKAMQERTQAFQTAMSYMSKNKALGKNDDESIEKTLEVFAKAQAEAELRRNDDDHSGMMSSPMSDGQGSLVDGLERRLRQVAATFSEASPEEEEEEEVGNEKATTSSQSIVVVPTSGAQSQKIMQKERGEGSKAPLSKTLRDDLMQAVQMELQNQITGANSVARKSKSKAAAATTHDSFETFMDDTNKKLEAISKQLITLQGLGPTSTGTTSSSSKKQERIVIVRPPQAQRQQQGKEGAPFSQDSRMTHPKDIATTASSGGGQVIHHNEQHHMVDEYATAAVAGDQVTFSTIKKNAVQAVSASPLAKNLIVGHADGTFGLIRDRRRALKKLADVSVRSIEEGRETYLRQQRQNDEFVYANTASNEFDPVNIAETLTDLIIDDLLADSAKELSEVCDSICDNVFEQEFNTDSPKASG